MRMRIFFNTIFDSDLCTQRFLLEVGGGREIYLLALLKRLNGEERNTRGFAEARGNMNLHLHSRDVKKNEIIRQHNKREAQRLSWGLVVFARCMCAIIHTRTSLTRRIDVSRGYGSW